MTSELKEPRDRCQDRRKITARFWLLGRFACPQLISVHDGMKEEIEAAIGSSIKEFLEEQRKKGLARSLDAHEIVMARYTKAEIVDLLRTRKRKISGKKEVIARRLSEQLTFQEMSEIGAGYVLTKSGNDLFLAYEKRKEIYLAGLFNDTVLLIQKGEIKKATNIACSFYAENYPPRGIGLNWAEQGIRDSMGDRISSLCKIPEFNLKSKTDKEIIALYLACWILWGLDVVESVKNEHIQLSINKLDIDELRSIYKKSQSVMTKESEDAAIFGIQLTRSPEDRAGLIEMLAKSYSAQGRYGEAEILYKQSVEIQEASRNASRSGWGFANLLEHLADAYKEQGKFSEAEGAYKRSLIEWELALGRPNKHMDAPLRSLIDIYKSTVKCELIIPLFQALIRCVEVSSSDFLEYSNGLADWFKAEGEFSHAETVLALNLSALEIHYGATSEMIIESIESLADFYSEVGRDQEAMNLKLRAAGILNEE